MTLPSAFAHLEGPVHFIGVAGSGMVPLAELMARKGIPVTGCDLRPELAARTLSPWGSEVFPGHDPAHVEGAGALVVTAAVPGDHPEILRARELGIPVMKRAEALGEWVNDGLVVAVAGTHGKTTTTAMATEVLAKAGMDPTGLVGGRVAEWGSNLRMGGGDLFVVEADEYDRSFHHLRPRIAVLTNLEVDHLDIYGDLEGVRNAFRTFLDGVVPEGRVVACGDDHGVSRLLAELGGRVRTYGLNPGSQLRAVEIQEDEGGSRFQVIEEGTHRGDLTLGVSGLHNIRNALGASLAARSLEVEWEEVREALRTFKGVGRRFELVGEVGGVTVIDDYAHHPTEIRATLAAARNRFPGRRIVAVFQPHLFSRTRDFAEDFGAALAEVDELWVTEIYPAREAPIPGVDGMLVAQAALNAGASSVSFHPEISELPNEIALNLQAGDVVVAMGAGSIETLAGDLLAALRGLPEGGATPMKRWLTFVFVLALAVAVGGVVSRIPEALAEVDAFRVTEIRLRGARFLSEEEATKALALSANASVWDDTGVLETRLAEHPLVREVTIYRRFPSALLVKVVEEEPVALFPTPTLEPVDEAGRILPIDPAFHKLDLPIMASAEKDGPGSLTPAGRRILAEEISRLAQGDPEFHDRISDFALNARGDVRARISDSSVTLYFRPGLPSSRIQTGLRVLADAQSRFGERAVADLDLRFDDQVIVRVGRAGGV